MKPPTGKDKIMSDTRTIENYGTLGDLETLISENEAALDQLKRNTAA